MSNQIPYPLNESNPELPSTVIGRKIKPKHENPIDNILLDWCEELVKPLSKCNITPNMITIFRMILGTYVLNSLFTSNDIYFPIMGTAIFYFLDCVDGHLARSTNTTTVTGDYLDHISDIGFFIVLVYWVLITKNKNKEIIIAILIVSLLLALLHIGLQQKNYKYNLVKNSSEPKPELEYDNETLDQINKLHNFDRKNIIWTKYFGFGTLYTVILISIYYIKSSQ